jgi:hypothetical protein
MLYKNKINNKIYVGVGVCQSYNAFKEGGNEPRKYLLHEYWECYGPSPPLFTIDQQSLDADFTEVMLDKNINVDKKHITNFEFGVLYNLDDMVNFCGDTLQVHSSYQCSNCYFNSFDDDFLHNTFCDRVLCNPENRPMRESIIFKKVGE